MQIREITVPIVLIIFNRPYLVEKQMECLRKVMPKQLFIISDAARENNEGEQELVCQSRNIAQNVDWDCMIEKIYADKNMGCDQRIVSGLNAVFSKVDKAIILEDDCLPNDSFFAFCQELLLKYECEEQIMYISGSKWATDYPLEHSYGFSYNTGTWGWATWRRAWMEWHWDLSEWNEKKKEWLKGVYSIRYCKNWVNDMECYIRSGNIPWDYVWRFCVGKRLSIFPVVNLIENIGFGDDATHTKDEAYGYVGTTYELGELKHPDIIDGDLGYTRAVELQYRIPLNYRVKRKLKKVYFSIRRYFAGRN